MEYISCEDMKKMEVAGDEAGLTYYNMMENAGHAATDVILQVTEAKPGTHFAVFCGKGNNGGDGFVVARLLTQAGMKVSVVLVEEHPKTPDAITNFHLLKDEVIYNSIPGALEADIVIDAIYGTGYHGSLRPRGLAAVKLINSMKYVGSRIISLDIPSGLPGDVDSSADLSTTPCVIANETIMFHRAKYIGANRSALGFLGNIHVCDIGIDSALEVSYVASSNGHAIPIRHNICMNTKAVCIILHGYESSMESPTAKMMFRALPKVGISALSMDFPGHGESFLPMSRLTAADCAMDIEDIENYIHEIVPNADIYYFGSSFGAYNTLLHLGSNPHLGTKAFLRSCAVNMDTIFKGCENLSSFWKSHCENASDCKIVMIHGTSDESVPYKKASAFAEAFNIPLITVENGDHSLSKETMPEKVCREAIDFFS